MDEIDEMVVRAVAQRLSQMPYEEQLRALEALVERFPDLFDLPEYGRLLATLRTQVGA
jgi:hypothetical protein